MSDQENAGQGIEWETKTVRSVAELADTWVGWAEIELRNENFDNALKVMATATKACNSKRRTRISFSRSFPGWTHRRSR